jgi:hypothetical protein
MRRLERIVTAGGMLASLLVMGCREGDTPMSPDAVQLAKPDWTGLKQPSTASCAVTPSGVSYVVTVEWSRVPTKEIRIIRETIPGPQPETVVLPTQKRSGSVTVTIGFFPTTAFLINRNQTAFVRVTCVGN